tara:strand:- start:1507 stop:1893 length:387 start_codon:yes stop_codon:yes gene_type:complete
MNTVIIVGLVAFIGGGAAGIGIMKSQDKGHKVLEAQTQSIDALLDGQTEILVAAQQPVILDAELKATLSATPPACVRELGGDPMSAQCALLQCWAMGNTSAQRPSCSAVEQAALAEYQNGKSSNDGPD